MWFFMLLLVACGDPSSTDGADAPTVDPLDSSEDTLDSSEGTLDSSEDTSTCTITPLYATKVISFTPGLNAGYGQETFPEVVLGPPLQGPPSTGSLDVLSLGIDGTIVLGFDTVIQDGPGPDFIVWENAFWIGGNSENVFQELGEVSVSEDGVTWTVFPCDSEKVEGFDAGCAGWRPRLEFDPCSMVPLVPELVGGDPFDLSDIGVPSARYVRIRDRGMAEDPMKGVAPSAGFDLDAVGVVHSAP